MVFLPTDFSLYLCSELYDLLNVLHCRPDEALDLALLWLSSEYLIWPGDFV